MKGRVLILAPHPDDEVLGVGGTIAKLAESGVDVRVAIVTRGFPPAYNESAVEQVRCEARDAHALLGARETVFLDFPAAALDTIPHSELNAELGRVCADLKPDTLFVPFNGDIHLDHQRVFMSALVAARPSASWSPSHLYAYETLSETNWNAPYLTPSFHPTTFVDIAAQLDKKIAAMKLYTSQVKPFPHERSCEALQALAMLRGSTVGVRAAEAFVVVRQVL